MSKARPSVGVPGMTVDADTDSGAVAPFAIPANSRHLLTWLDEQPCFVEFDYRSEARFEGIETPDRYSRRKRQQTLTGQAHVPAVYERVDKKSHSSQGDVVDAWTDLKFPSHNIIHTDRGLAAELYTLSSYTTGVEGPSERRRQPGLRGGMQEIPAGRLKCNECGWESSTYRPGASRATRFGPDTIEDAEEEFYEHRDSAHDGDARYIRNEGHRTTESEKNYRAVQYLDGAGRVEHYDRTAAVRSRYGVVLSNSQDFAKGRARCTWPSSDEKDAHLPLSGVMSALDDRPESVYDVTSVEVADEEVVSSYSGRTYTRDWFLLRFDTGAAFGVIYDETAQNYHERRCGFYFPPEQADNLSADGLQADLRPAEVDHYLHENDDAEVIGSQKFSQAAGRGAGGKFYDPERQGRDVVRQGEWYFVPLSDDLSAAIDTMGLHDAESWGVFHEKSLQEECNHCGESRWEIRGDDITECMECGSLYFLDSLGVSDPQRRQQNPLGSHRPREVVTFGDYHFVRGMIRHDTRDHNAINLGDTWHLAIDNGRDGFVFDTSTPDDTSGRAGDFGGTMRVE